MCYYDHSRLYIDNIMHTMLIRSVYIHTLLCIYTAQNTIHLELNFRLPMQCAWQNFKRGSFLCCLNDYFGLAQMFETWWDKQRHRWETLISKSFFVCFCFCFFANRGLDTFKLPISFTIQVIMQLMHTINHTLKDHPWFLVGFVLLDL